MKFNLLNWLLFMVVFSGFSQEAFSQVNYSFSFKKGVKFHYRGELVTDTITTFPTKKPFSKKDYNAKFVLNDLIVTVDTSITVDSLTFVRFTYNYNSPKMIGLSDVGSFFQTNSFCSDINLVFYKNMVYKIDPYYLFDNLQTSFFYGNEDSTVKSKMELILKNDYDSLYNFRYFGKYNMLKIFLNSSVIQKDGIVKLPKSPLTIEREHIIPLFNLSNSVACKISDKVVGDENYKFSCLANVDTIPGVYGGSIKVFKDSADTWRTLYFYSDGYFISKIVHEYIWDYSLPVGHSPNWSAKDRHSTPYKYTLSLFKIDE